MSYTAPTDPILYIEAGPIFSMRASGAIKAGQCLTIGDPTTGVRVADDVDQGFVGVAGYAAANNDLVQVIGPGNIVRSIASAAVEFGDPIMVAGSEGKVCNLGLTSGNKIGVAMEAQPAAEGTVVVLLT
jgi:hypothetical protein